MEHWRRCLTRVSDALDPSALQWPWHEARIPHPSAYPPPPYVAGGLAAVVAAGGGGRVCLHHRAGIAGRGGDAGGCVFDGGDG